MAAARFSYDMMEMFYELVSQEENQRVTWAMYDEPHRRRFIGREENQRVPQAMYVEWHRHRFIGREENRRQMRPIEPERHIDFYLVRNNFNEWLRVRRMDVPEGYPYKGDLLIFAQKTKTRFTNLIKNEIASLGSNKTQFGFLVKSSIIRDNEQQCMEHYFKQRGNSIFNRNDEEKINDVFNKFTDEVKGDIEVWSQRGFGWKIEGIMTVLVNVVRYEPFRGRSYLLLPKKCCKNKKAIINVQNRDNKCLRWSLSAALFPLPPDIKVTRTTSYPTEDGLDFTEINFLTPVSQIDKLRGKTQI